jgi:ABC-type polar amino acid transport system ATPase subunit
VTVNATEIGMTMLVVTHEMGFAREVSSRMAFVNDGQIIEEGPPEQVINDPKRPETRRFLEAVLWIVKRSAPRGHEARAGCLPGVP